MERPIEPLPLEVLREIAQRSKNQPGHLAHAVNTEQLDSMVGELIAIREATIELDVDRVIGEGVIPNTLDGMNPDGALAETLKVNTDDNADEGKLGDAGEIHDPDFDVKEDAPPTSSDGASRRRRGSRGG